MGKNNVIYNKERDQFFYGFPDTGDAMWTDSIKAAERVGEVIKLRFLADLATYQVDVNDLIQVPLDDDDIPIFTESQELRFLVRS